MFLCWQPKNGLGTRYIVGELKQNPSGNCIFSYLTDTEDYRHATQEGFSGYPAFKSEGELHNENVLGTFLNRLPPRKRKDFSKYLSSHYITEDFSGNDFSLLAHTSAKLPSDGFTLIPDLSRPQLPFDYVLEVAGTRHHVSDNDLINIQKEDAVTFIHEENNPKDRNAIAIYWFDIKIGYVNRILSKSFTSLLSNHLLQGFVLDIARDSQRPLIRILIKATS
mgnify:CR=1 FL=1